MGVFGGENRDGKNCGFGNLVSLRPIDNNDNNTIARNIETVKEETTDKNYIPGTQLIRISEKLFQRIHDHAKSYYNVEPYETIFTNLLDYYEQNNKNVKYYHLTRI